MTIVIISIQFTIIVSSSSHILLFRSCQTQLIQNTSLKEKKQNGERLDLIQGLKNKKNIVIFRYIANFSPEHRARATGVKKNNNRPNYAMKQSNEKHSNIDNS